MDEDQLNRRQFTLGAAAAVTALSTGVSLATEAQSSNKPGELLVGAAEIVITPTAKGTFLIGPMQESTGIHDDLYGRALVLSDGVKKLAIITTDYLGFDFQYNDFLLGEISRASGLAPKQIMLNASHNHSAPLTIPWGPWEKKKDKPWHQTLPKKLAEVVKRAVDRLEPARLRYHREATQISFNRRFPTRGHVTMAPNPNGVNVPWVDVLAMERKQGGRIGALFSYAAHPVIVHGASTQITADYPGFAVRTLQGMARGGQVFMFAQGCGGDINGFPLRAGIDAAEAAGRDLGHAVARGIHSGTPLDDAPLLDFSTALKLPLQRPPAVEKCRRLIAESDDENHKQRLKELLAFAETGQPGWMPFPIRAFALGNQVCFLGLPHEMFAEYQHFALKESPFKHTLVFGYTNGCECYVPLEKDLRLGEAGGYEAGPLGAALMYHRRLALDPGCEALIKQGIRDVLSRLHGQLNRAT